MRSCTQVKAASSLSIVFASERLLPAAGGAERSALECLGALAIRHEVRACFLPAPSDGASTISRPPRGVNVVPVAAPPPESGYWASRRAGREAVGRAVADILAKHETDVVVTQLHATPAVVAAAHAAGVPVALILPSYESLCKYAFDADSRCSPASRCRACPRAAKLGHVEARELFEARDAQEHSLATAERLVAPSRAVAEACARWCGRSPEVIPPVVGAGPLQPARRAGHVLLAATRWSENKGLELLVPLCRALEHRRIVVTKLGLTPRVRAALRGLAHVNLVPTAPIESLLSRAGLLLVPSQLPEAFGRVAFEGLAAGVPTLVSAVGGLTEFVPPEQLVEPPGSVEAWVAAVRRLETAAAWKAARRLGVGAARELVADSPPARFESVVRETAHYAWPRMAQRP